MENKVIYFDNNATTCVAPEVLEAMMPYFSERYGNPSSIHRFGGSVAAEIENARCKVAELLGATFRDRDGIATEIIFTSCGTESDNAAINSAILTNPDRKKIVTSAVEHPGILSCLKNHERNGIEVVKIPVDKCGRLDMEALKREVDENTCLVTVMWANNETGTIFPIKECAAIAHAKGALFHTDAVQAAGKVNIDVEDTEVDFLSISGHKLHAPKGIGVLYVRKKVRFMPTIYGGHQERLRRGGTENVTSIIGLGKACELAAANIDFEQQYLSKLRNRLEELVRESVPNIRINGDLENRLPNTTSISFEYIEGESILMFLDMNNICASSGSACTSGSLDPSHVLLALGLPHEIAHGSLRLSLSEETTMEQADFVVDTLKGVIERLRGMSPLYEDFVKKNQ